MDHGPFAAAAETLATAPDAGARAAQHVTVEHVPPPRWSRQAPSSCSSTEADHADPGSAGSSNKAPAPAGLPIASNAAAKASANRRRRHKLAIRYGSLIETANEIIQLIINIAAIRTARFDLHQGAVLRRRRAS